mmetsp:Transcript_371/g.710  ORF Transcript_371/g.710 Transcript_371/m.710 type:complete len:255 (+) Transcript_371:44-808(+)
MVPLGQFSVTGPSPKSKKRAPSSALKTLTCLSKPPRMSWKPRCASATQRTLPSRRGSVRTGAPVIIERTWQKSPAPMASLSPESSNATAPSLVPWSRLNSFSTHFISPELSLTISQTATRSADPMASLSPAPVIAIECTTDEEKKACARTACLPSSLLSSLMDTLAFLESLCPPWSALSSPGLASFLASMSLLGLRSQFGSCISRTILASPPTASSVADASIATELTVAPYHTLARKSKRTRDAAPDRDSSTTR